MRPCCPSKTCPESRGAETARLRESATTDFAVTDLEGTARGSTPEELSINTIRTLSMDAVQRANSGHPGTPMALAPLAYALWMRHLRHNPRDPAWVDRDRFILSTWHASMLLYSLLYLIGYELSWRSSSASGSGRARRPDTRSTI